MKIVVDCRYTRIERHDGISRYTAGLVTALAERRPLTMLISDERQLAHLPPCPHVLVSAPTSIREPFVARQVNRLRPDVVFTPMQTMGSWGRTYPLVLTVHDLIYYRHPTPPPEFAWPVRLLWRLYHTAWWPQRVLLNRADAVVTVSETTKALIAQHRLTRRPVTVVPNAPDPVPDPSRLPRTKALVYMGSFMPYKNVETLARAMALLPDHELHLMSRVSDAQRARLRAAAGPGTLVFHDGATDETYVEVLRGATALVSASRDEGFGIPLVEAMAVGTPLVVSDIPVFREVGGSEGAAVYVPPDDAEGFAAAVRELEERWDAASAAARRRAEHYTWERSAEVLLELLEELARR
ncbi:Glycosyltransferase involved in cell wall bisynthesis [Pseudonocardia thermophila]|uniref:Glycosyltransferase involved in cell wall bisynthesis n=1 Tax=Pseudonocardia thermophila TaxID=1848 RepID=A0A1M6VUM4_PSETH|nr:glycosyltransferase family 1 protein [Pseudonocardia thermophila]SHK85094.1 Glycosyltransferase involved in cell wall bisynthesis [Pseudonocardia thermophila]